MRDDTNWGFNPDEVEYIDIPGVFTGYNPGMYYYVYSHNESQKEEIHGLSLSLSYNFTNGLIMSASYDFIDDIGKNCTACYIESGAQRGYVGISRPKNRFKLSLKKKKVNYI